MAESQQVYCRFCEQKFVASSFERCPLCRKSGGLEINGQLHVPDPSTALLHQEARPEKRTVPIKLPPLEDSVFPDVPLAAILFVRLLRMIPVMGGAFALLALGYYMITDPAFRTDPKHWSWSDLWPGLGPIVAGLVLLGIGPYFFWRGWKAEKAKWARQEGPRSAR